MKRKTATRNALFTSIISLLLCVSMLVGTTFAWFTDSVASGVNHINAGNLDVELYYGKTADELSEEKSVKDQTNLFTDPTGKPINLWEPGVVAYTNLQVVNKGNLALKYNLSVNFSNETVVNGHGLSEALKVAVVEGGFYGNRVDAQKLAEEGKMQDLKSFVLREEKLETNEMSKIFGLVIYWQPTDEDNLFNMNNENQGKVLSIDLGINLFATQVEYADAEYDSFGPDYDADSWNVVYDEAGLRGAVAEGLTTIKLGADITLTGGPLVIPAPAATTFALRMTSGVTLNLGGFTLTGDLVNEGGLILQDGTVEGNVDLTANTSFAMNSNTTVGDIILSDKEDAADATANIEAGATFENIVAPDENGANQNLTPEEIAGDGKVVVKDDETGKTTIMDGEAEDGMEYVAEGLYKDANDNYYILNVKGMYNFAAAVNDGDAFNGKTVCLSNDVDLNNEAWTPIGNVTFDRANSGSYKVKAAFKGTFDGQNYTVMNIKIDDPDANGVGLFGAIDNATIKNVKVENVDIVADGTAGAIVGYCLNYSKTSTIENCHVSGDISIVADWAYVGGIAAYGHANISDCSVIADGTGVITSENRNAVAGIMGWNYGASVTNCQVKNLELTGWANVGGIEGYIPGKHTISGCSVENVTLTKTREGGNPSIGLAAGGWSYSAKTTITVSNNTFKNITMTANNKFYSVDAAIYQLVGSEYGGATTTNFVIENNTQENVAVQMNVLVFTIDDLRAALDAGCSVTLAADITGDVTVTQKPNVKLTIDGNGYTFAGAIIVDGKSATYTTAGLTVKNVNFKADSISADACVNLGNGTNATRYTCNVTVENCTFDVPGAVGIKSYTGGDKNVTVTGCTAKAGTHSLCQLKGVDGALIENCEVYSKNGMNFNNSTNVTISGCTTDVKGYAVRFGEGATATGNVETYMIENSVLKSACDDGDAVIVLRGTADKSTLTVTNTTLIGDAQIKDTAIDAIIVIDGKYYVSSANELAAVVANGATDIYLLDGEYDVKNCGGKTLTISGSKNAVIKLYNDGEDGCDYAFGSSGTGVGNYTFNGVTFDTTGNTGSYKGFAYMKGTFNDCSFVGAYSLNNANDFAFNRCTFDFNNGYFWTWGANSVTFDGCTFNGNSKSILAHGWASTVINIKDCNFAATEKGYTGSGDNTAAVEIDPAGNNTYTINFTGENTINDNYAGWTRIKDGSTGHTITGLN